MLRRVMRSAQFGLVLVILLLGTILTVFAGSHVDPRSGVEVNNFLNSYTLIRPTDASSCGDGGGATIVIISGGIDLSVGRSMRCRVSSAMVLRALGPMDPVATFAAGAGIALAWDWSRHGERLMVVGLKVHQFDHVGTMWMLRASGRHDRAESILLPDR